MYFLISSIIFVCVCVRVLFRFAPPVPLLHKLHPSSTPHLGARNHVRTWNLPAFVTYFTPLKGLYFWKDKNEDFCHGTENPADYLLSFVFQQNFLETRRCKIMTCIMGNQLLFQKGETQVMNEVSGSLKDTWKALGIFLKKKIKDYVSMLNDENYTPELRKKINFEVIFIHRREIWKFCLSLRCYNTR